MLKVGDVIEVLDANGWAGGGAAWNGTLAVAAKKNSSGTLQFHFITNQPPKWEWNFFRLNPDKDYVASGVVRVVCSLDA